MKTIYIVIPIIVLSIMPLIPADRQIEDGVTLVDHKSFIRWVYDRYQTVQQNQIEPPNVEEPLKE